MKLPIIVGLTILALGFGKAAAQGTCGTTLTKIAIENLVVANTCICGAPGASRPNLLWNETHTGGSGGTMNELGLAIVGTGSAVGTYAISGSNGGSGDRGVITYTYTGGGTFAWVIDDVPSGTTYRICSPGAHTTSHLVKITSGVVCLPNC